MFNRNSLKKELRSALSLVDILRTDIHRLQQELDTERYEHTEYRAFVDSLRERDSLREQLKETAVENDKLKADTRKLELMVQVAEHMQNEADPDVRLVYAELGCQLGLL